MKHRHGLLIVFILCSAFACTSGPAPKTESQTQGPAEGLKPVDVPAAKAPESTPTPETPREAGISALEEPPAADLPSVDTIPTAPKEGALSLSVPEPAAPKLAAPAPAAAVPKTEADAKPKAGKVEAKPEKKEEKKEEKPAKAIPVIPELPTREAPKVEDAVTCSRTVRATVGQLVEVPYRGAGWVFLGERSSQKGLPYDSRRLDADGQSFIFKATAPGSFDLQFYKRDFVEDYLINDTVRVVISEPEGGTRLGGFSAPVDHGRVVAEPRWPLAPVAPTAAQLEAGTLAASPAAAQSGATVPAQDSTKAPGTAVTPGAVASASTASAAPASTAQTSATPATPAASPKTAPVALPSTPAAPALPAIQKPAPAVSPSAALSPVVPLATAQAGTVPAVASPASPSAPAAAVAPVVLDSSSPPDAWMAEARRLMEAGSTAQALTTLDSFSALYPQGSDEAYWLYGRILESNGPNKDIKRALDCYQKLIDTYPQSQRYDESKKRIAWLKRYYFEIR